MTLVNQSEAKLKLVFAQKMSIEIHESVFPSPVCWVWSVCWVCLNSGGSIVLFEFVMIGESNIIPLVSLYRNSLWCYH